jgi:hypothetical protein
MTAYEQYLERQHLEHHHEVAAPAVKPIVAAPVPSPVAKPKLVVVPSGKPKPSAMGEPLAPGTPPAAAPVTPDAPPVTPDVPKQTAPPVVPPAVPQPQPQP